MEEVEQYEFDQRRSNKRVINNIVLGYQKRLKYGQSIDHELLAKKYFNASRTCIAEAHRQGIVDAGEA